MSIHFLAMESLIANGIPLSERGQLLLARREPAPARLIRLRRSSIS